MGLPVIQHPIFTLILPSTKQTVTFRPFLVKEEKMLLVAQSSGEQSEIVRAIKQVVQNCILDTGIDVNSFTTFDLEYFFIKLRAKSVQSIISLSYRDNEDSQIYDVEVNLEEIEVKQSKLVSDVVQLSITSGIKLKYPQMSIMDTVEKLDDPIEFNFAIMQACIDTIYDGDNVYKASDFSRDEVRKFIDDLDVKTYKSIQDFVDAMPRIEHTIGYTNSNGKEVKITLRNLNDFFTLG